MNKTPINPYSAPDFPLPKGQKSTGVYLRALCFDGLCKRIKSIPIKYLTRLDSELCGFAYKGWGNFLLILHDLVEHLRKNGVNIGPGSGVAPGSLVMFALGITELDPLVHGLLFERCLPLNRKTPPDFDLQLSPGGREIALIYLGKKYGAACVLTVEIRDKVSLRRVLAQAGYALEQDGDIVRKNNFIKLSSGECREKNVNALFTLAVRLQISHAERDIGAASVAFVRDTAQTALPLEATREGAYPALISLPRADIIRHGIAHLNILEWGLLGRLALAEKIIRKRNSAFSLASIPLDDPKTFNMLSAGRTAGLEEFKLPDRRQDKAPLMREYVKEIKPVNIQQLAAITALYRPGPICAGLMDLLIKARQGRAYKPAFLSPITRACLSETCGVLVYQEQLMQIAKALAGFSAEDAETLRRDMSRKKLDALKEWRIKFIADCEVNGLKAAAAGRVFDNLNKYSGYLANKAHVLSHALVKYRMAYIKANYGNLGAF